MGLEVEKKKMVGRMNKIEEKATYLGSPLRSPLPAMKNELAYDLQPNQGYNQGNFSKSNQPAYSNNYNGQQNDYYGNNYNYDEAQSENTVFKSFVDDFNDNPFGNGGFENKGNNMIGEFEPIIKKEDSNIISTKKNTGSSNSNEIDPVIKVNFNPFSQSIRLLFLLTLLIQATLFLKTTLETTFLILSTLIGNSVFGKSSRL